MSNTQKLILVIGATGAQGQAVVDALLAPDNQGARSFEDLDSVARALDGAYGAWVNTDGFTVGEIKEIITGFDPEYKVDHMDAKARVADWLRAQPSVASEDALSWSIGLFDPLNVRADGTVVFAAPVANGQIPMIALKDLGWWARYTFDHRLETSGSELNITSECVGWDYLVETFTKVTGKTCLASDKTRGDGSRTIRNNFSAFWRVLRDDIVQKDMDWIPTHTSRDVYIRALDEGE
ncbi:NAD-P-binding protein [Mycena olivaceomarginata]|nr:NAD-P-binding protein [Mycena olivaceomarginata]